MSEAIPWEVAKEVAERHGCRQVILVAWDGESTHVVTYGNDVHDSDQAAQGGNFVKKALGWPDQLCQARSPRVVSLEERIEWLREATDQTLTDMQTLANLCDEPEGQEIVNHVANRMARILGALEPEVVSEFKTAAPVV